MGLKGFYGFLLLVSTVLIGGCTGQPKESESKDTSLIEASVRLPIPIVDAAFAPFYLAQDKGIFTKHGLEIKLELGSPELNPVKMVDSEEDEFGILGGPELAMTARDKGAKIKGFALLHKNSNFACIITKKESGLTTLQDLEGKDVGFFYGHISTDVLKSLFKKENINVNEVDVGFNYNQFIADKLPAQWAFTTTAGVTLPAQGIELNFISPADYGIITHGYTFITTEKIIQENPELVDKFLSAMIEATEYALGHREEAIEAVVKRGEKLTKEVVEKSWSLYEEGIRNNDKVGWFTIDLMQDTKERMSNLGLLSKTYSLTETFDTSFIKRYYEN